MSAEEPLSTTGRPALRYTAFRHQVLLLIAAEGVERATVGSHTWTYKKALSSRVAMDKTVASIVQARWAEVVNPVGQLFGGPLRLTEAGAAGLFAWSKTARKDVTLELPMDGSRSGRVARVTLPVGLALTPEEASELLDMLRMEVFNDRFADMAGEEEQ